MDNKYNSDGGNRNANFSRGDNKVNSKPARQDGPRINEQIRVPEVRLILEDGEPRGVVSIGEARQIADSLGLDLVEVSPNATPPVVKVIDYGKYRYELQKKQTLAKKKQVVVDLKELQLRPNIEKHDLEVKLKKAKEFIDDGDKIKLVMQFRGRELSYTKQGMEKLQEIVKSIVEYGASIEADPKLMGNRIIAILAANKKK
ncbi:MAG: translation initiation factor IF-3 [Bacteriovoracaceae bacterium]